MTTIRLLVGTLLTGSFAATVLGGQDASAPAFSAPPVTIHDASGLTNAPIPASVTLVPEPALPEVTVPRPAEIAIPSATAVQSGPVAPASHPQPVMPPTSQGLLSRSMQSSSAGPANRLAAIAAPTPPAGFTNNATPGAAISSATNSANQTDIWQKSTPSLNGVNYHW
jgi:hypothetical protein